MTERRMNALTRAVADALRETGVLPDSLADVVKKNGGSLALTDGWQHPIGYVHAAEPDGIAYAFVNPGSDGVYEPATHDLLATPAGDVAGLRIRALAVAQSAPRIEQPWYEATRADYVYLGPSKIAGYSLGSVLSRAVPSSVWMPRAWRCGLPSGRRWCWPSFCCGGGDVAK